MPADHKILGIDHIQLAAPAGCEQHRRFFGEILGMRELPKPQALRARGGVWFECGAQQLHVGVDENFAPNRKAHPALAIQNLAALRERLHTAGIEITEDESLPGTERFYANDPFGNRLEFLRRRP
ncbi:MAG TPA: VOC family protein [Terriglobales bacterium]|nr:VOC family protein [Terriglobales bacterium]